jgi:O-antigen/teichoic acid export membrane protein
MILFISMVIIIVILLIGDYLIKSLYGDYFHEVYSVLILLLPGSFFFNITQILSSDLSGRGYPSFGMKSGIVVLLVSIGFNLVFISRYGLISVAIISSLTYFLGAIILIFYFLKITKSTFKQMFLIRKSDFKFNIIDES